jgi:carbon-monoxide dehydrogenase medium subunit
VKPAPFAYRRPETLRQALADLAGEPNAKVLAGGQSLVPLLSMRLAAPAMLIDINGLPGLADIDVSGDGVRVGALARHADLLASAEASRVQPLLAKALAHVAHATIRNRGTTVGSIVHADAAAEMPVVLTLLGGSVDVESLSGRRTIAADDLFLGPLESSLHHDEIAVSAFFPALAPGAGVAFDEIARRHGDYALCGVAALVRVEGDAVLEARAGYLSVNELPTVLDLSAPLAGGVDDASLAAAGETALAGLDPAEDIHGTVAYRAQLVRVLTARVLRAAYDHARSRQADATIEVIKSYLDS